MKSFDDIKAPAHYLGVGKIEPMEFIIDKQLGFAEGNIVKYVVRAGRKPGATRLEDLKKAQQYLNKLIAFIETNTEASEK